MGYLSNISTQLGIPVFLSIIILLWTLVWKLLAIWKAAQKKHVAWFIVIALLNTVGILPILYIYVFSEMNFSKKKNSKKKKAKKK